LQRELGLYAAALLEKPMLVAANKIDALDDRSRLERLEARANGLGLPFFAVSGVTGRGVPALVEAAWPYIAEARTVSIGDE
jgi:GTP-binding protein